VWLYSVALSCATAGFRLKRFLYWRVSSLSTAFIRKIVHRHVKQENLIIGEGRQGNTSFVTVFAARYLGKVSRRRTPMESRSLSWRRKGQYRRCGGNSHTGLLYILSICAPPTPLVTHTSAASSTICSFTKGREVLTSNRPSLAESSKRLQRWLEEDEADHCCK
jgi:hypothetical protein